MFKGSGIDVTPSPPIVTRSLAVALIGEDRPGVVAALTGFLLELECNLEDVSTSILRGHFSIMLVAGAPDRLDVADARAALDALSAEQGFTASLWQIRGGLRTDEPTHVLSVYGRDRPGIVHALATLTARLGVNICDMTCRLHDDSGQLYVVTLEIHVPKHLQEHKFWDEVLSLTRPLELDASLQPIDQADL